MELQERALRAPLPVLADEAALAAVAAPHRALNAVWNVARGRVVPGVIRPGTDTTTAPRFRALEQPFELVGVHRDGLFEAPRGLVEPLQRPEPASPA
jgi:hypothetical protein